MEVVMRTRRLILIPAIAAFGFAGTILASPAMAGTTGHTAAAHAQVHKTAVNPFTLYHA
jgi:hypothetical protein